MCNMAMAFQDGRMDANTQALGSMAKPMEKENIPSNLVHQFGASSTTIELPALVCLQTKIESKKLLTLTHQSNILIKKTSKDSIRS